MLQAKDNLKPLVVSIRDIVEVCSNYDLPTPHQVGTVADNAEIPVGDPAQGGALFREIAPLGCRSGTGSRSRRGCAGWNP